MLAGAIVRLAIGAVKFLLYGAFVIGALPPFVEVVLMPLYVGVWATAIVLEQLFLLAGFYGPPVLSGQSNGYLADEQLGGIADIIASVVWIIALTKSNL